MVELLSWPEAAAFGLGCSGAMVLSRRGVHLLRARRRRGWAFLFLGNLAAVLTGLLMGRLGFLLAAWCALHLYDLGLAVVYSGALPRRGSSYMADGDAPAQVHFEIDAGGDRPSDMGHIIDLDADMNAKIVEALRGTRHGHLRSLRDLDCWRCRDVAALVRFLLLRSFRERGETYQFLVDLLDACVDHPDATTRVTPIPSGILGEDEETESDESDG